MTEASEHPAASIPPTNAAICVTDRVIVRVSGPGTDKFLHGQFSQSLDEVTPNHAPRAAACTAKGRAYCLTRLARDGEDVLFDLPAELADGILGQLRKYLMLFRGTNMNVQEQGRIIGLLGEDAGRSVTPEATRLGQDGGVVVLEHGLLIRTMDTAEGLARYEYWLPTGGDTGIQQATDANLADWHASEIDAGVPWLTAASQEQYVPQMLNWQHLNGIHFKKGCYTGQEVIARMHFLGQLKKSLFRLASEGAPSDPVTPGSSILAGGKECGTVVNSIAYADGTAGILAVIRHASSSETLTLEDSTPVHICPLPYSVPERAGNASTDT